jgi:hypothetical protein
MAAETEKAKAFLILLLMSVLMFLSFCNDVHRGIRHYLRRDSLCSWRTDGIEDMLPLLRHWKYAGTHQNRRTEKKETLCESP